MGRRASIIGATLLLVVAVVVAYLGLRGDDNGETTTTLAAPATTEPTPDETTGPPTTTSTASTSDPDSAATSLPDSSAPDSSAPDTTAVTAPADNVSTTTTTLPPADDPDAGEEANEPVPLGQAVVHRSWEIGVSKVDLDAGEVVAEMYEANQLPAEGFRYVLVELSGTNIGDTHAEPVFDIGLVNGEVRHPATFDECGQVAFALIDVIPQPPGGHMAANICFNVPEEMVDDDLVLTLGFFDEDGREKFFALR